MVLLGLVAVESIHNIPSMLSYSDLQRGYQTLKSHVNTRKAAHQQDLKDGKEISSADEAWIDMDANLIDEDIVLERLSGATNIVEAIELLPESLQKAANALATAGSPPGTTHSVIIIVRIYY